MLAEHQPSTDVRNAVGKLPRDLFANFEEAFARGANARIERERLRLQREQQRQAQLELERLEAERAESRRLAELEEKLAAENPVEATESAQEAQSTQQIDIDSDEIATSTASEIDDSSAAVSPSSSSSSALAS